MKAFWIDRETNTAKIVETDGKLEQLYDMCHCGCIDITVLSFDGNPLNIVVDDEGLLVDKPMCSVFDTNGTPLLAGSVVVFGMDDEFGDLAGLKPHEIEALMNRNVMAMMTDFSTRNILLADAR